jgi:hypothetical protein
MGKLLLVSVNEFLATSKLFLEIDRLFLASVKGLMAMGKGPNAAKCILQLH